MRLPVRNMPKILGEGSNLSRIITSKSYFEVILEIFAAGSKKRSRVMITKKQQKRAEEKIS